jgi:hypothetical protein
MTEEMTDVALPIDVKDLGEPIMGWIMTVVWGALAALLGVMLIAEGISRGFDKYWWVAVPTLFFAWLSLRALESARGRKFYTVTADQVQARIRRIKSWCHWTEPMGNYSAVEISSEHHNVGQGSAGGSFTATLIHSRDSSKNVELKGWSWSRGGTLGKDQTGSLAAIYTNQLIELLGMDCDTYNE